MKLLKNFQRYLFMSGIGCFIAGVALCLIPVFDTYLMKYGSFFSVLPAIMFWLGIIIEAIFSVLAYMNCNAIEKVLIRQGKKTFHGTKPGIIRFFTCKEAVITDIVFIVSFIAVILSVVFNIVNDWIFIIAVLMLFFSFNLHCFFNGKNYKYLKEIRKFSKNKEREKNG